MISPHLTESLSDLPFYLTEFSGGLPLGVIYLLIVENFLDVKCLFMNKSVHFENDNSNARFMLVSKSEFVH